MPVCWFCHVTAQLWHKRKSRYIQYLNNPKVLDRQVCWRSSLIRVILSCFSGFFQVYCTTLMYPFFFNTRLQTVLVGGILLSRCLSATFWFFNIVKRQWWNFIKFGKHIDIHKMNIYYRKIRARDQFIFLEFLPFVIINVRLSATFWFFNILKRQWQNFIKFGKYIDIHKRNIYISKIRARGQFC